MACVHAILTESSSAAFVDVAWLVVEVAKGTPMKDKLNPLIDLHAPDQDTHEKARSSKLFAFIHLLGGCKLIL